MLTPDEILEKVAEAVELGATQIMLQGGLNPGLGLAWFEDVLRRIKKEFTIFIHSFSPPEIHHLAKKEGLSYEAVIARLRDAGLDSLPGAGAEILAEGVRAASARKRYRAPPGLPSWRLPTASGSKQPPP